MVEVKFFQDNEIFVSLRVEVDGIADAAKANEPFKSGPFNLYGNEFFLSLSPVSAKTAADESYRKQYPTGLAGANPPPHAVAEKPKIDVHKTDLSKAESDPGVARAEAEKAASREDDAAKAKANAEASATHEEEVAKAKLAAEATKK